MFQVDLFYEFFSQNLFKDFDLYFCPGGVVKTKDITLHDLQIFNHHNDCDKKILFYDQEPLISPMVDEYIKHFKFPIGVTLEDVEELLARNRDMFGRFISDAETKIIREKFKKNPNFLYREPHIFVSSEISPMMDQLAKNENLKKFYYFFHGFASLDWYRGFQSLNFDKKIVRHYQKDYVTMNRTIVTDRSYRIYLISKLVSEGLISHGLISMGVADDCHNDIEKEIFSPNTKLSQTAVDHIKNNLVGTHNNFVIDGLTLPGSASADIIRNRANNIEAEKFDSFWHVVTETVFYYDKLHLTEKIFKPIVSKQPFMLLAAPGNLAYLRRYGFKTFSSVIDESYDTESDNDRRIDKVVEQLKWYCSLSDQEKTQVQKELEPIIEHNFNHFYGEFKHIIVNELLINCQRLFKEIGYDDSTIAYKDLYKVLTS